MQTSHFDYNLPEELIAQYPAQKRDDSRMLVLDKNSGAVKFRSFHDLEDYLNPDDLIVANNTKVMNARIYAKKSSGAKIEILLLNPAEGQNRWYGFVKPAKRVKDGTTLEVLARDNTASGEYFSVVRRHNAAVFLFDFARLTAEEIMREHGHIPLPPYIKREDEFSDSRRYQTVFAGIPGAVAAPTAGLHFTEKAIARLKQKNIDFAEITLHVGAGTFKPVETENIEEHKMHSERFLLDKATADIINEKKRRDKKIIAVGTTCVRVLESCVDANRTLIPQSGETSIFIYPPYKFKAIDMLLTNFHLPKSTLLMLVSAFAGTEAVMNAYQQAVKEKMRFYSYGDCMLIK